MTVPVGNKAQNLFHVRKITDIGLKQKFLLTPKLIT